MAFCNACGTQLPQGAVFCPACGKGTTEGVSSHTITAGGLTDNLAGVLAYVTFIPAIVFLVLEPYNRNRFVRFHSFQSILLWVALAVVHVCFRIVLAIPFVGWMALLVWPLYGLAAVLIWIVLVLKTYQGEMFKLPVIGELAGKQANPA